MFIHKSWSLWVRFIGVIVALVVLVPVVMAAGPTFNDPGFANTWNRTDKPVSDLAGGTGRGYTWGPTLGQAAGVTKEFYNGGQRTVQYFDKARMEVNNPNGNPNDLFYVTTGLLVKEMLTGKRQDGDNLFSHFQPSEVQVAGDSNDGGANSIAPTYASFQYVATFSGTENGRPSNQGQPINEQINRAGQVSTFTSPEQRYIAGYDSVTKHNIPDVFVNFANVSGPVWNGTANTNGKVLFDNPVYVLGRPLTEAYWTRAVVRGVEQDVLVQLYERRVLTYTPANPDSFKVEMGNVGQHYYRWRYVQNGGSYEPPAQINFVSSFGEDKTGVRQPYFIAPDSKGNFYIALKNGSQLYRFDDQGNFLSNLGQDAPGSGPSQFNDMQGIAFDGSDNLYVADSGNHRIQKFDDQGHYLLQWSVPQRSPQFNDPYSLVVDQKGNVYTLDYGGVRKYDNQGHLLADLGGELANDRFNFHRDFAVDDQGTIYLLDVYNNGQNSNDEFLVKKFDAQGHFLLQWQTISNALVLTVDRQGNVLVGPQPTGKDNQGRVLVSLLRYNSSGESLSDAYQNISSDPDALGVFKPAVDKANNIFSGSIDNNVIYKLDSNGKLLAKYYTYGHKDGQVIAPYSLGIDKSDNLYIYDGYNYRVQKFDKDGHFLLKWGSQGSGDGQFNSPQVNLAVDDQGNVFSVDPTSKRVQKFDSQGHLLFKFGVTSGSPSCEGIFTNPSLVTVDSFGTIYVFDNEPNTSCIEKFDSTGHFLAHFGGGSGDKVGQFYKPLYMTVNRQGNLYIADGLGRICIYATSSGQLLKCWTGKGINLEDQSDLRYPTLDPQGNIYVTDALNKRLIKYDPQGTLLAFWDNPFGGVPENTGVALFPTGFAIDSQNNLYVLNYNTDRVQKFQITS